MFMPWSLAFLVVICACSDGAGPADSAPDIDNGTCGAMVRFTGEYIDWDSGGAFCGIFGAEFEVQGGGQRATTPPNGRIDLCIADQPQVLVNITPPTAASECATASVPSKIYALPSIAVATKAVIVAGGIWRGRAFVTGRETVDPAKAQVFVHVNGTPRQVSLAAPHTAVEARTGDAWAPGDVGEDIFFFNVDPGGGSTTLSAASAIGTGSIPLAAGKMTDVSILGN